MKKWGISLLLVILVASTAVNGFLYNRQAGIIQMQATTIQNDEARIASLQTDIAGIEERLASLNRSIQTVAGNLSGVSGSVSNLESEVVSAREGIASLEDGIQNLTGNVSGLSDSVNSLRQAQQSAIANLVTDFITATDKVKPSVVVIQAQVVTAVFGRVITRRVEGSGWIIDSNGIIVTNSHVIADADTIRVTLEDGRTFPAVGVQADVATDLAVLKIDARNLPTLQIGDSDRLKVGQPVAAIGNALGLGINMTGGWISRLNTSVRFNDGSRLSGLIGTDTAINPGNSGGPLINLNGEVIGITNAKLVETGVEGLGYAISINNAIGTINSLIARL